MELAAVSFMGGEQKQLRAQPQEEEAADSDRARRSALLPLDTGVSPVERGLSRAQVTKARRGSSKATGEVGSQRWTDGKNCARSHAGVRQGSGKSRRNSLRPGTGQWEGRGHAIPRLLAGMLVTLTEVRGRRERWTRSSYLSTVEKGCAGYNRVPFRRQLTPCPISHRALFPRTEVLGECCVSPHRPTAQAPARTRTWRASPWGGLLSTLNHLSIWARSPTLCSPTPFTGRLSQTMSLLPGGWLSCSFCPWWSGALLL